MATLINAKDSFDCARPTRLFHLSNGLSKWFVTTTYTLEKKKTWQLRLINQKYEKITLSLCNSTHRGAVAAWNFQPCFDKFLPCVVNWTGSYGVNREVICRIKGTHLQSHICLIAPLWHHIPLSGDVYCLADSAISHFDLAYWRWLS